MKRATIILIFFSFLSMHVFTQGCLPDGITFSTQGQIDDFPFNYPGCSIIEGSVEINGDDIQNLDSLIAITEIYGSLIVINNLDLVDFSGLDNLESVGFYVMVANNESLQNFNGLDKLASIGNILEVVDNNALSNFSGLNNLTSIGGGLIIYGNDYLAEISDLSKVDNINGRIDIAFNNMITSLDGLQNVNPGSIDNLTIYQNNSLSVCNIQSICNYLSNPAGIVNIYLNDSGCMNPEEIANSCGFVLPCLPFGNYHFYDQVQVDSFQVNFPDCYELNGYVNITGTVSNTAGLNRVQLVNGGLSVRYNSEIENLSGLDSLRYISGQFDLWGNTNLSDISALHGLDSIGYGLWVNWNPVLTSLDGLDSVKSVGEIMLAITSNENLTSINGIRNIDHETIAYLDIYGNTSLSECHVQSVCDYITSPGADINITDNNTGCNTPTEVEEACTVAIEYHSEKKEMLIYPNPANEHLTIVNDQNASIHHIKIYNQLSKLVYSQEGFNGSINLSSLRAGLYIIEIRGDNWVSRKKLVVK